MLADIFSDFFNTLSDIPLNTLLIIIWGTFGGLFLIIFAACFISQRVKRASKRPYFALVNAFSALTLAAYLTKEELGAAVLSSVLFWLAGYLSYGILCLVTKEKKAQTPVTASAMPVLNSKPIAAIRTDAPAAKSNVRLEHALSVTENLLQKNLGKSDRQELERLKNTLDILQMKGNLTPEEGDVLNDNFNALLKLMAKYNM